MLERFALEEFHDQEYMPLVLAGVVNDADVGMIQRARRASFAAKSVNCLRILGGFRRQKLKSDKAA